MKNAIAILNQYNGVITEQELDELLPEFGTELVMLWDISMSRKRGYGQYEMSVEIKVGKSSKTFKVHSTDSQLFDEENTDEKKRTILEAVLNYCEDEIQEWAYELQEIN